MIEWHPAGEDELELSGIVQHGVDAVLTMYGVVPTVALREVIASALLAGFDMGTVLALEDAHAARTAQAALIDQALFDEEAKAQRVALFARYRMLVPR